MDALELLNIITRGETSRVQFKEILNNQDSIAAEFIAMANSHGGLVIFGVADKTGDIKGLTDDQIRDYNQIIGNIATNSIKPQLFVTTDVVSITIGSDIHNILVVFIDEGIAKPYKDNQGRIWIKQGSDKRIVTDNNEQIRLFQQSGMVYIDEMIIPNTSITDVDEKKVMEYLGKIGDNTDLPNEQIYRNINLLHSDCLTLGGLMFFAAHPQSFRSAFCVKAVSFFGNNIEGSDYRDSEDIDGTIPEMFEKCMGFLNRNLKHTQQGQNFNSTGILEVSPIALEELLQNALTHRDYSRNSPIRLFIFDDRIELLSPGRLPNSLTIENIKMGNAVVRNPLIVSYASKIMRYRGIGSGIRRALREQPNIEFINDIEGEQFKVIIPRNIQQ